MIGEIIFNIMIYLMIFGVPLAVLIWFVVSLIKYFTTPAQEAELRKRRRKMLIFSGILTAVFVLAIVGLIVLVMMSIAHM